MKIVAAMPVISIFGHLLIERTSCWLCLIEKEDTIHLKKQI